MNFYDLDIFKNAKFEIDWNLIFYGLKLGIFSKNQVKQYLDYKLENKGKLLESEMNLLLDLMEKDNNLSYDEVIKSVKKITFLENNKNINPKIIIDKLKFISFNYLLNKYKNNFPYFFTLCNILNELYWTFNNPKDLENFCYYEENYYINEAEEKIYPILLNEMQDYLNNLAAKNNWILN